MEHWNLTPLKFDMDSELKKQQNFSLPRHKPGEKFLKGPIPEDWLAMAALQPGRALHVGMVIWFLAGVKRTGRVRLSLKMLSDWGVKRYSVYRGLNALEKAGLVIVDRHCGRNPIVTILKIENTTQRDST